ncbi:MAG: ATP-binding protein [Alphaproteobacteria bacterium]|nr:ATP-binding protein [Alphaproteobacteria bacterium]MBU0793243.1 ATP-binding protein [Alphaproteobacteria bacterium]MBU0874500.1 ATP-binding protein [Alphaproteobacteria bacterium]MBU1769813.1 ATP-binding protein [Alphaproteobacteria bacterium]
MATKRTATLTVRDFACFTDAQIEIDSLTIIVGPQASGKSLLARLIFFFGRIPEWVIASAEQGDSLHEFRRKVELSFLELFPSSAWGRTKFKIDFAFGDEIFSIHRRTRGKSPADFVQFSINSTMQSRYLDLRERFEAYHQKFNTNEIHSFYGEDRARYNIRNALRRYVDKFRYKTIGFTPAGRSFFTTMGKAVSAFDSGGLLDEITLEFGRRFMGLRGNRFSFLRRLSSYPHFPAYKVDQSKQKTQARILASLIAGEFVKDGDNEFFLSSDGRKVPFANLSSGQQELFPLLATLILDVFEQINGGDQKLSIVEEPEAHLFPSSQSRLVELFASSMSMTKSRLSFLITTHSPYVLAKLNNLLKADEIFSKKDEALRRKAANIIDPNIRIKRSSVRAYCINGGKTQSILRSDGLIVAEYIDSISEAISEEFEDLLELQYG